MADDEDTGQEPTTEEPVTDTTDTDTAKDAPADSKKGMTPEEEAILREGAAEKQKREAVARRHELNAERAKNKKLQDELEALKVATASEAEKALIQVRLDAAKDAEARWKPALVTVRAEAALSSAGCRDADDRDLLLGKIDLTKVELDESGRIVSGLDEQVADLKERHAKLFAEPKPAVPSARTVGAGDKTAPPVKKSVGEQLAARLTGQR